MHAKHMNNQEVQENKEFRKTHCAFMTFAADACFDRQLVFPLSFILRRNSTKQDNSKRTY